MYRLEYGANGYMGCMGWMLSCAASENRAGYWFPYKPTKKQVRRAVNGKLYGVMKPSWQPEQTEVIQQLRELWRRLRLFI